MKALSLIFRPIRYIQGSIHRKILLSFFIIIILTVSVLSVDFYYRTSGELKRQSIDQMMRLTHQSSATLNSYMSNTRSFAWNYFGDTAFQEFVLHMGRDPDAISYYQNKFIQFVNDNPIISSINVIRLNGFSTRAGYSPIEITQEERNRLMEAAIALNGKGEWIPTRISDQNDEPITTLTFVQAIRNISLSSPGEIIGVMMYEMSYAALQEWFKEVEGEGTNHSYIVHTADGSVVYSLHPDDNDQPIMSRAELDAAQGETSGYFTAKKEGESSLVVYQKLNGTEWILLSKYPTKLLLKPVHDFTIRTMIIGTLSLLISMLLASVLSTRTITPLKELRKGMKSIEFGNFDINLPIRSKDEIGYLSASFNSMAVEMNRLVKKVYETEIVKKNAEIKALQSQINPHFLYNTLGIIDSLSAMDGDGRVSMISRSLAKMFRYNISGVDISTLEKEVQQIRMYLSIQKIRFDTRLNYSIYLEPGLEEISIPKLLFQPLVENSVNHGISRSVEGGMVRVEVITNDAGDIEVSVWNNGCPIEPDRQIWLNELLTSDLQNEHKLERDSIGLINVQTRIRLMYGNSYGITFHSNADIGTAFKIQIAQTLPEGVGGHEGHHHRR